MSLQHQSRAHKFLVKKAYFFKLYMYQLIRIKTIFHPHNKCMMVIRVLICSVPKLYAVNSLSIKCDQDRPAGLEDICV